MMFGTGGDGQLSVPGRLPRSRTAPDGFEDLNESDATSQIKVLARFRCRLDHETEDGECLEIPSDKKSVTVSDSKAGKILRFQFDEVFGPQTTQKQIYEAIRPMMDEVFQGYSCTIMTYGQTGSGKTYTMEGPRLSDGDKALRDPELKGCVPRLIDDVFQRVYSDEQSSWQVTASFLEVYKGKVWDCLSAQTGGDGLASVHVRSFKNQESQILGMTNREVASPEELLQVYKQGLANRVVGATAANPASSRGHGVFDIKITQATEEGNTVTSLLRLIDLAGSEQAENTGEEWDRRQEAKLINVSLSFLSSVVQSLSQNEKYINYRHCTLTRVVEQALGGNSRTMLIVTGSPMESSVKMTINTLRFAAAASTVQIKASKNQQQTRKQLEALIRESEQKLKDKDEQLQELKRALEEARTNGGREIVVHEGTGDDMRVNNCTIEEVEGAIAERDHEIQRLKNAVSSSKHLSDAMDTMSAKIRRAKVG